ncbi:MAG TPA: hypothetical protein VH415_17505 [Nitrososphaeraceae archaeon]|jgi:hypothetical protein
MERNSVADILKVISDNKSLDIFCSIAKGSVSSESLKLTKGLTKKQYYIRTKLLLRVGVVQRSKGTFSLTNFGAVVYHAQLIIEAGLNNFWKLKAIDSIQSSGQIREEERLKLVRTILNDNTIESILVKRTA